MSVLLVPALTDQTSWAGGAADAITDRGRGFTYRILTVSQALPEPVRWMEPLI